MTSNMGSATPEQIEALLNFLLEHSDLARGRLRGDDGKIQAKRLWEEICNHLNSMGGCIKTIKQWQKGWADRKYLAKKAAAVSQRLASTTGGGPSTAPQLSQWELKVLSIMGEGFGERQTRARVPAFPENHPLPPTSPSSGLIDEPASEPQPIRLDFPEIADANEAIHQPIQLPESAQVLSTSRHSSQRRRNQPAGASVRSRLFQLEEQRLEREAIRNRELAGIRAILQELCGLIREYINRI